MKKTVCILLALLLALTACLAACEKKASSPQQDAAEETYRMAKDFEAELYAKDASLLDCKLTPYGGAVGGVAVGYMDYRSSSAAWTVEAPAEAYYAVTVRYNCGAGVSYDLFINEQLRVPLGFAGDGTFRTASVLVRLKEGENVLKVRNPQGQGYSAVVDMLAVKGLETPAELASLLTDMEVAEGAARLPLPAAEGFALRVLSSSDPSVVAEDGSVFAPAEAKTVRVRILVSRGEDSKEREIAVRVAGKTPSAEETAREIFSRENGKVIEKGKTSVDLPALYEGQEYYIAETSDAAVISRNGTVSAGKEDKTVQIRYLVRKADGTSALTGKIAYTVEGLGYDVGPSYMNPLGEGEDPYVTYIDGYYYHIQAQHGAAGAHLEIIRSASFIDFREEGFKTIYNFSAYSTGAWNCSEIWGPFPIMKWSDGHYYIYYAADDGNNNNHREGVLRSVTEDPLGEYEDLGIVNTSDAEENAEPSVSNTVWAIGATVYHGPDENSYLVWSGWKNNGDQFPQRTYMARIYEPDKIGARVEISSPTEAWEGTQEGTPIMEGQAVFNVNGRTFMLYSANASWAGRYRLGMLVYEEKYEGGYLNPQNWVKREEPLFESSNCIESPGGPCLVPTPDGKEWWLLYHSSMYEGSGWTRYVSAKPVRFDEEGLPVLDGPLPFYTPVRGPSGDTFEQTPVYIAEAEEGRLSGGLKTEYCNEATGGEYVYGFAAAGDKLEFTLDLPEAGAYRVIVRYAAEGDGARHVLRVNGKNVSIAYTYYGYNNFFTAEARAVFQKGENALSLEYVEGYDVKIDFIGVSYVGE